MSEFPTKIVDGVAIDELSMEPELLAAIIETYSPRSHDQDCALQNLFRRYVESQARLVKLEATLVEPRRLPDAIAEALNTGDGTYKP